MWETVIVLMVVATAAAWLVLRTWRSWRRAGATVSPCRCADCGGREACAAASLRMRPRAAHRTKSQG